MIEYWYTVLHRGYAVCRMTTGGRQIFVAMTGSEWWWEGETPEEVCALIDAALDEP